MRLPSLSITLSLIAICWCVFGVAIHGWYIMLYPAAWLIIGLLFFIGNKVYISRKESAVGNAAGHRSKVEPDAVPEMPSGNSAVAN